MSEFVEGQLQKYGNPDPKSPKSTAKITPTHPLPFDFHAEMSLFPEKLYPPPYLPSYLPPLPIHFFFFFAFPQNDAKDPKSPKSPPPFDFHAEIYPPNPLFQYSSFFVRSFFICSPLNAKISFAPSPSLPFLSFPLKVFF